MSGMGDDEARRLILARRARFVAAALTGLTAAMCGGTEDEANPRPCLDVAQDGGTPQPCLSTVEDAAPQPCLDVVPDAGDGGGDAGEDAGDADAGPQPCLKVAPDGG
jgi:hypothetical protein